MIEGVISRLNGEIEDLKQEAIKEIRDKLEAMKEEGDGIYSSSVSGIEGAVLWLGTIEKNGFKTGGGLFNSDCYLAGYKIEIKKSNVEGSNSKYINISAELTEISRDELIDLLYDEQQKKMIKSLANDR